MEAGQQKPAHAQFLKALIAAKIVAFKGFGRIRVQPSAEIVPDDFLAKCRVVVKLHRFVLYT
jgi:hypothetical protein